MKLTASVAFIFLLANIYPLIAQNKSKTISDTNTPLYLLPPDYPVPYGPPSAESVKSALDRMYTFLETNTPPRLQNKISKTVISDFSKPDTNVILEPGLFRLTSYEWGVTYGAMLKVAAVTGDNRFSAYTQIRTHFLSESYKYFKKLYDNGFQAKNPLGRMIHPLALDDCGSLCTSFIKMQKINTSDDLRPIIDTGIDFVLHKEHRMADSTLARVRPFEYTVWLDDMYMGIPCLAQMGSLTGDSKYYDEAAFQILKFAAKMFVPETGLFRHGWVEKMNPHPSYHWGRANGWAILTLAEVLDVLPENHPKRAEILEIFRKHCVGLAKYQTGSGFWHQLLDRNDSYLETSATAIFTYCFAHGINQGWLDSKAYGPQAVLGWNALSTKINEAGQVEGTCVGTGMGFDPAFYYYRPVNAMAAHGYGPALLAGAEILQLLKNYQVVINETSVILYPQGTDQTKHQIK